MYGSRTNSEGGAITEAGSYLRPIVGPVVTGNELIYIGLDKDADGNINNKAALVSFKQSNGAIFSHKWFDGEEGWRIDELNANMLHICSKIVTEEEYYEAVSGSSSFEELLNNINTKIFPKAKGMVFTLKIIYTKRSSGKYYAAVPKSKWPKWMENAAVVTVPGSTFKHNEGYDIYEVPMPTEMATGAPEVVAKTPDDLPF
jgi:hypothetical protein